jgi:hypothetical protein
MAISRKSLLAVAAAGLTLGACATDPYYGTGPYYDQGYAYGYAPGPYYEPAPYVAPSVSLGFGFGYSDRHYDGRWHDRDGHDGDRQWHGRGGRDDDHDHH